MRIDRYRFIFYMYFFDLVHRHTNHLHPRLVVNLNNAHRNILFNRDSIYFLNGCAYDFYSIDELNNRSEPSLQWKTFPLPHEDNSTKNSTPWVPHDHLDKKTTTVYVEIHQKVASGLAFVDRIYITTRSALIDRQNNLKRMMARYQITNYEWRMKWKRDNCYRGERNEEFNRKFNFLEITRSKNNYSLFLSSHN